MIHFFQRNIFILFGFCMIFTTVYGQDGRHHKPPQKENTYYFNISNYNRQPEPPKYIEEGIQKILETPTVNWTAYDSLIFAYESVHLEKFERALNNFARLNIDTIQEPHAQILCRVALQQSKRFNRLLNFNQFTINNANTGVYDLKSAYDDLTTAYINNENKRIDYSNDTIFKILFDDTLNAFPQRVEPHRNEFVKISFAVDSVLRQFSVLHDNRDMVLSKAFEEMGDFQKKYFYITNAHFYYSAALHYDKNNKNAIQKYKAAKDEISRRNFFPISFKTTFGRVIKNRYRLSEDYIEGIKKKEDIPENFVAPPQETKKDYLPWLDVQIVTLIVVFLVLLFVLFFIKTKEK